MKHMKKLTLLHSNDLHGDFMAEDVDKELIGGVSMLSGYVNKVREEEKNAIYCIAGDMFRGSVIDSEFKGISTIEIMNMLAPDVVAIGNHETDYGIAHLLFIEKCAKFPIINANLHITTNNARLFKPHHIIEMDGMKILFIGILTEEVLSQTKNETLIGTFVDINEAAAEVALICNAYNALDVDCTVLLTHIGFEEDKKLAAQLDPALDVDIIIGGHSHTSIEQPELVNGILVAQAGVGTDQIGRFDLEIDMENNCVHSWRWENVPITEKTCPKDLALEKVLSYYSTATQKKYSRVVTRLKRRLLHQSRYQETELGGLLSDILRESLQLDIMLLASGSVRSKEIGPLVLLSDLTECFPYDDAVYLLRVTGAQLKRMILFMLRDEVWTGDHCEFYQFSEGMQVVYDRANHSFKTFRFRGRPVEDETIYRIGLQHFHFVNVEDFFSVPLAEITQNGEPKVIATSCRSILDEYLSANQNLERAVSGRLIVE